MLREKNSTILFTIIINKFKKKNAQRRPLANLILKIQTLIPVIVPPQILWGLGEMCF